MMKNIKVAVCGELSVACEYLFRYGVVQIDKYSDATEIIEETDYNLILIYAPNAEGLLNTVYTKGAGREEGAVSIPIRLLNEPCCHSALLELKFLIKQIAAELKRNKI